MTDRNRDRNISETGPARVGAKESAGAPLPIDSILPELLAALRGGPNAVLQAPPGAGKTTRVPLALLGEPWLAGGRILVLEPRRIATYAAARRMAELLGEEAGATVGYRMRLDARVSRATRIEIVTEGVFLRQLQADPALGGVGAVLFDEFHERSLDADLGLALCLEAQAALRPDLRLLAMSATLDGGPVARLLGDAPIVASEGRSFPVETRYLPAPPSGPLDATVAVAVRQALAEERGSILVFLPGTGEIRRVQARLEAGGLGPEVALTPLYGDLPQEAQRRAILPAPPGRRKLVLATAIAETSLTIEGVRIVIDCGYGRKSRFDPRSLMARLETLRVSRAAAEQRRGRAGRLEPGVCYRLWTEAEQRALVPFDAPEILTADLTPLALQLALWGAGDPAQLSWLDPPPAAPLAQARALLAALGALAPDGTITEHGKAMAALGAHPRLAHMMLKGRECGLGGLACDLAALLGERDFVKSRAGERDADIRLRLDLLHGHPPDGLAVDGGAVRSVARIARQWRRQLGLPDRKPAQDGRPEASVGDRAGALLALAYPDRVAQRRPGAVGQFRLRNGRGATLPEGEPLAAQDWLAVADLDAGAAAARIFLAAPLTLADIEESFAGDIETVEEVRWDAREQAVLARRQRRLGALLLKDEPLAAPPGERVTAALIAGIRALGLTALPWTRELASWRARVMFLRGVEGAGAWPDLSDEALLAGLEDWLAPFLSGVTRRSQFERIDLGAALRSLLDWERRQALDRKAPTHHTVPSGSRLPLDYADGRPVLAVRLQEMFGATDTPAVADGRVPVLLHLLSPAGRPVQVTQDLPSFWASGYRGVKADLKGRYPKHDWPDDPLQAQPTSRAKPRRG